MASPLERTRYYARERSRHERRAIAIYQSLSQPDQYRVTPIDSTEAEREWVPEGAWVQVEAIGAGDGKFPPNLQPHQHWFMTRLWQESPTKRRKRRKTPSGRRSCYYDIDPCVYCGTVPEKPSTEHVIAKSHGGPGGWENRVSACYKCNTYRNNWPLLLWLTAIHEHGSPRQAAKVLGTQYPDRTVFYKNELDSDADDMVKSEHEIAVA